MSDRAKKSEYVKTMTGAPTGVCTVPLTLIGMDPRV